MNKLFLCCRAPSCLYFRSWRCLNCKLPGIWSRLPLRRLFGIHLNFIFPVTFNWHRRRFQLSRIEVKGLVDWFHCFYGFVTCHIHFAQEWLNLSQNVLRVGNIKSSAPCVEWHDLTLFQPWRARRDVNLSHVLFIELRIFRTQLNLTNLQNVPCEQNIITILVICRISCFSQRLLSLDNKCCG